MTETSRKKSYFDITSKYINSHKSHFVQCGPSFITGDWVNWFLNHVKKVPESSSCLHRALEKTFHQLKYITRTCSRLLTLFPSTNKNRHIVVFPTTVKKELEASSGLCIESLSKQFILFSRHWDIMLHVSGNVLTAWSSSNKVSHESRLVVCLSSADHWQNYWEVN